MTAPTRAEVVAWRDTVAARVAKAQAAGPGFDPIAHDLTGHLACIAELDAWIADIDEGAA